MATAVSRDGELYEFIPQCPTWYRRLYRQLYKHPIDDPRRCYGAAWTSCTRWRVCVATAMAPNLRHAHGLEWERKKPVPEVYPGMPIDQVKAICDRVAAHNQDVCALATFWKLAMKTLQCDAELSPYLDFRQDELTGITAKSTEPAVRMTWRENVQKDWCVPTTVMDATMHPAITREFY